MGFVADLYIYARTQQLPLYDDLLYDARRDSAALRGLLGKEQASAAGTQVTRYGPAVHRRYGPRCSTCSAPPSVLRLYEGLASIQCTRPPLYNAFRAPLHIDGLGPRDEASEPN